MHLINCKECGNTISQKAPFCPHCGAPTGKAPVPQVVTIQKSKGTAAALAILLGGIGLHKFYLNQPGQGILYILFCWTFIPAILGLLEGLSYLTYSQEGFQKKYG
jgi:TM2 domain-containing membrane protein YozV